MSASFLDSKSKEIIMDRVDTFSEEEQVQIFKLLSQTKSSEQRKIDKKAIIKEIIIFEKTTLEYLFLKNFNIIINHNLLL